MIWLGKRIAKKKFGKSFKPGILSQFHNKKKGDEKQDNQQINEVSIKIIYK